MTTHAKVTTIEHTAAGMGQVWYRVTGQIGVASAQVAYRSGTSAPAVRRVRFVGAGATADLLGFRPGELVTSEADLAAVDHAFSGEHLTHGVKTQRSRLARVPATPIRDVVTAALARAGAGPDHVFVSRDAAAWWSAVDRAGGRGRSVSFLSAAGVLKAVARAGVDVSASELHSAVGAHVRAVAAAPIDARASRDAVTNLLSTTADCAAVSVIELGEGLWSQAAAAATRHEPVGNSGYELTLTLPKSISLYALSGDPADADAWFEAMEAGATRALAELMAEAGFCSTGHRGDGEDVRIMHANGWAGFIATEISSRAGDPHLHVHCTVPNVLVGVDGLVRTMADGGRELIVNAPRFASWGQSFVLEEAKARGLISEAWFDPVSWQWQVGGFTDGTITAFSRGRQRVLAEVAANNDGSPVTARVRSRRDRAAKARATDTKTDNQPTWNQMRAMVDQRTGALGLDVAGERSTLGAIHPAPSAWDDDTWASWVLDVACEHESTTSLAKVRALIDLATTGMPEVERERITRMVLNRGFVRGHESRDLGMKTGGQRWISADALAAEQWLILNPPMGCVLWVSACAE